MNYKIKLWWDKLTEKERDLLISKLYEMDLEEIGINTDGKYKEQEQEQSLRNQIIDLIKEHDEQGGIEIKQLKHQISVELLLSGDFEKEIQKLLEDGVIFEPKVNFLRWLG